MININNRPIRVLLSGLTLTLLFSYHQKNEINDKNKDKQDVIPTSDIAQNFKGSVDIDTSSCDPNIWKHVYNPTRLEVINKCMTVTGVIEQSSADDDGDQHMLLKLDAGQENLLKKRNVKKKNGNLVIEAVCMNNITNPKVGGACKGYINHLKLPEVGDHVKVSGSYVIDTHNGWAEIHPISKIVIMK